MSRERYLQIAPGFSIPFETAAANEEVQLGAIKIAQDIAAKYYQADLTAEYLNPPDGKDTCERFVTYALLAQGSVPIVAQLFSAHALKCPNLANHTNTVISFAQVFFAPKK